MKKKHYSKIELFIRSLTFSIAMAISTMLYSFFCILIMPFPLNFRYKMIVFYTNGMIWFAKKICHIEYKIEGLKNIPKNRNGIILSKHQSTWETFILPGIFSQPAITVKRELLWVPFFGWGLAITDPIAINRSDKKNAMNQVIQKGKKVLDDGRWVLVFPEGTRIPYGKIGHYRLGGARLATKTGYPVIPVAHNAGKYWPKRGFIKQPGTVHLVIGPLIETANRTPEEVMEESRSWIEDTIAKL